MLCSKIQSAEAGDIVICGRTAVWQSVIGMGSPEVIRAAVDSKPLVVVAVPLCEACYQSLPISMHAFIIKIGALPNG